MPIYEYICDHCGHVSELLRSMRQADAPAACERCASEQTTRKQSAFYADDGGSRKELSLPTGGGAGGGCGCGNPHGPCT